MHRPVFCFFHSAQHRNSERRCQLVSLSLYRFFFKQQSPQSKSFQSPLFICSSHRNWLGVRQCPPVQTLAKCGRLHGLAFTWWNHKSSAAIQLWINHAECEILPQEKPCDCVCVCMCVRDRKRVSHILCNSQDCIPRKLVRGSLRTVPGCRSNTLSAPILCCLCSRRGVQHKMRDNLILSHSYYLLGWRKW